MDNNEIASWLHDNDKAVEKIVGKFDNQTGKFSREDLKQEAATVAVKACRNFDITKGNKLLTYAYISMHRGCRDFVRQNTYDVNLPICTQENAWRAGDDLSEFMAARGDTEIDDEGHTILHLVPSGDPDALHNMCKEEQVNILYEEISKLNERESEIVRRHNFDGDTFATLSSHFGISRQRAERINAKALEKLKQSMIRRLHNELLI